MKAYSGVMQKVDADTANESDTRKEDAMNDKDTDQYSLEDKLAYGDVEKIADFNAKHFYELKKDLVKKRQKLCSLDRIAEILNKPLEQVAAFEQYYSDPTVSQLQEYALAVMCVINIHAADFCPEESSMYSQMSVPVDASELVSITHSAEASNVTIKEGKESKECEAVK